MEPDTKEVAVVKQQATKAVTAAQELVIKDAEGMTLATDVLAKIKKVAKMAKERKEAITKPLSEALNSARDLFKPIEANCAEAEQIIKRKMVEYDNVQTKKADEERLKLAQRVERGTMKATTAVAKIAAVQEAPKSVQGASGAMAFRMVKKYRVVDETLIPREYLVPDTARIFEALKRGVAVPGAECYEDKIVASSSQLDAESPLLGHKQH